MHLYACTWCLVSPLKPWGEGLVDLEKGLIPCELGASQSSVMAGS